MQTELNGQAQTIVLAEAISIFMAESPCDYDAQLTMLAQMSGKAAPQASTEQVEYELWEPFEDYSSEWVAEQIMSTYRSMLRMVGAVMQSQEAGS